MKLNDLNLNLKGNEVTVRKTSLEVKPSVLKKLTGVYDEFAKLVFLFDVSGSMDMRIARTKSGKSLADQFMWTPDILTDIRRRVNEALVAANEVLNDPMGMITSGELTEEQDKLTQLVERDEFGSFVLTADDTELKDRIVKFDLIAYFGIIEDKSKANVRPPTRLEIVKKLARQEIEKRFNKFPDSRVAVIPFGSQVSVRFDDGKPEDLWPILENLNTRDLGGGTDIMLGIKTAVDTCRKNPSAVGLHHFILVTDGEDYVAAQTIVQWVPMLKASGVVLDYIHIGDGEVNAGLESACKALGGEYVLCNTEDDFERNFVQACARLMLPAPASA